MARPQKVHSHSAFNLDETISHKLLMCSNVIGNNNKFYSLEIQKSSSGDYQLFSHYGRINGDTIKGGVYEVRDFGCNSFLAENEFAKIIKSKKRGKTKKKDGISFKESYEEVNVVSSNVGSSNVRSVASIMNSTDSKRRVPQNLFKNFESKEQNLLKLLEEENIHNITSSTTMTYTAGRGLQTPLGPLTVSHLSKAKNVLDKINNELTGKKSVTRSIKLLNNDYLSLIPRDLGKKISDSDLIATGTQVLDEYDLLKQMETNIQMTDIKESKDISIGFHMERAPANIKRELIKQIEKTRSHRNLSHYKVKEIYQIENHKERKAFESYAEVLQKEKLAKSRSKMHKLDYKEVDMFHGSRNSNILSILMSGFYVPPSSASHVTARMFGNGVYGADKSTKALNYSAGFWGGRGNKHNNIFCFITRFALGKVYETQNSLYSGVPSGYNSIFAKGGADLKNNEYIVPNTRQTTISYLVEFE